MMMPPPPVRKPRRVRLILLVALLGIVGLALAAMRMHGPRLARNSYLLLDLGGDYAEAAPDAFFGRLLGREPMSLLDLLTVIREAKKDPQIAGMVVRVRPLAIGWAKAQDIREALVDFTKSKKRLIAYLEHEFSGSTREYYVASAAREIYLPPGASAPLTGLVAQSLFLGGLWEKLDVDMQVEKIAEYKTFGDMLANKQMSAAHREMANALLDSIYEQVVTGIAEGRGLDAAAVRAAIDAAPTTVADFTALHLADGEKFLDDLREELLGAKRRFVDADDYRKAHRSRHFGFGGNRIAVVYGTGTIHLGEGGGGLSGQSTGSETMSEAFRRAAEDPRAKAIVFRIDSPGGSALASDLIWRATQQARRSKPLIVSMSDVAGSGGYYIAAGADRIIAQPGTLTGSIGVVLSKPNIAGLLAKLGINTESMYRGELARMSSTTDSFTPAERQRVVAAMNHVYDVFVDRVAAGRSLSPEQVRDVARGRVWTGAQARANGLVDQLGGFTAAIDAAKEAAGIATSEEVDLVFYPQAKPWFERIADYFGARITSQLPEWLQRVRSVLSGCEFPAGSILTLMPEVVEIH